MFRNWTAPTAFFIQSLTIDRQMTASLIDLETPALVVDLDRVERNLDRAARYARERTIALRPHIKTHKTPWLAAEQVQRGAVGVTCATPREAEAMSETVSDILVAYPPVAAARARRLAELPESVRLTVGLDSSAALTCMADAAKQADRPVRILIELDLGMRRVGIGDIDDAIALAHLVRRNTPLEYAGLMFYPGHIRERGQEQDAGIAALNRSLSSALQAFERAGVPPSIVSGGSTPTLWRSHEITGLTEIRPGTYIYNDRTTAEIGACEWEDCALTVLATVVSTAVSGQAVIDAGTKALGREPIRGSDAGGFGVLMDHPDVTVKQMSEEHGILDLSRTDWRPRVGTVVRVIPNHVCIVVHLADVVHGIRSGQLERSWTVEARGRERVGSLIADR
jgi:D-serine deaminase-like pyridoxal phosphate-dependent protein